MGFFKHFLNPQKIQTITSLKAREISISYSVSDQIAPSVP